MFGSLVKKLVVEIYKLTNKLPDCERFNLTSQMRRASVSVLSNIAEGLSRKSIKEKRRFLEISRSSLIELDTQIEVSLELNYLTIKDISEIDETLNHIFAMLTNLMTKIR